MESMCARALLAVGWVAMTSGWMPSGDRSTTHAEPSGVMPAR
jgi:hypothetical protein